MTLSSARACGLRPGAPRRPPAYTIAILYCRSTTTDSTYMLSGFFHQVKKDPDYEEIVQKKRRKLN